MNQYNILPFLSQKFDGEMYYRIENATMSFGFVGLNEMLIAHTGEGLEDKYSRRFGIKIIEEINKKLRS